MDSGGKGLEDGSGIGVERSERVCDGWWVGGSECDERVSLGDSV